jgi:hypothetical protein
MEMVQHLHMECQREYDHHTLWTKSSYQYADEGDDLQN